VTIFCYEPASRGTKSDDDNVRINFGHFFKAFMCVFIFKKEENVCFLTISNFSNNKKHKSCLSFFKALYSQE